MTRKGIALFGLGRAGSIHFRNIIKNHRLALLYVVEVDRQVAESLINTYNQPSTRIITPDMAQVVYKDSAVDGVIVATPTFTHEAIVTAALKHGKAVFCEKPIAQNPEATRLCYDEAERAGRPLLCSFNRRFDPSLRELRKRVLSGAVGKVHMVKSTARDSPLPTIDYLKISGGIFHDCAVHDIDLICWVLGDYPVTIYSQATAHVPAIRAIGDVDCVAIVMRFPGGILATIDLDRDSKFGYDQRLEVFGGAGMVVSDFQRPTSVVGYDGAGTHLDPLQFSFPQRYADSYTHALDHFTDVMDGTEKPEVTKENTLRVSKIADACEESHRKGLPITLDWGMPRLQEPIKSAQTPASSSR